MALSVSSSPYSRNILGDTGLSSKAITGFTVFRDADRVVFTISYSGGSEVVKVRQGRVEVGGDANWGSGTIVL